MAPAPLRRFPQPRTPVTAPLLHLLLAVCLVSGLFGCAVAKTSRRPITDNEIREKKNACYADIESGLWGWRCRSSMIEKENCALKCLSPVCYELIYQSDPLEEGEKDLIRRQEFQYCMHNDLLGKSRRYRDDSKQREKLHIFVYTSMNVALIEKIKHICILMY